MPGDRASLMNLKKPLVSTRSSTSLEELEKKFLGDSEAAVDRDRHPAPVESAVQPSPRETIQAEVSNPPPAFLGPKTRLVPKTAKPRMVTSLLAIRIPLELHERLRAVAHHNRLNMTDIVIEAVELHLQNFPRPT